MIASVCTYAVCYSVVKVLPFLARGSCLTWQLASYGRLPHKAGRLIWQAASYGSCRIWQEISDSPVASFECWNVRASSHPDELNREQNYHSNGNDPDPTESVSECRFSLISVGQ